MSNLRLAVPSEGALYEPAEQFLRDCGLAVKRASQRRYTAVMPSLPGVDVLYQRSSDIPGEVDDGAADVGITGFDRFLEKRREGGDSLTLYEDLGFGAASLVIAVPDGWLDITSLADLADLALEFRQRGKELRIATKYPRLVSRSLHRRGINFFTLVHASGGLEAAPVMGYADLIADITASGATLRENGLKPLSDGVVRTSQAVLIGNSRLLGDDPEKLAITREILERVEAYIRARDFQRLSANIQGESEEEVAAMVMRERELAGIHGPTISRVYSDDGKMWFGVQLVVQRKDMIRVVDHLRALGGSGITVNEAAYVFRSECESFDALVAALAERKASK
ncbi:MAG: ATP phosphoribosyltransferase [Chloroflexi bacterium]|nr:ATP phosphoribosyltransferase [Chloroflexota bacterium]MCH8222497.1 ATP phosphoribosyltransferase [Chloroflexota bacterium]